MSANDPHTQPFHDPDSTSTANADADSSQWEWARDEALAAGVPEAELDAQTVTGADPVEIPSPGEQSSAEDIPTVEEQPETQGTEPLIAELGRRGEGSLGPNDL